MRSRAKHTTAKKPRIASRATPRKRAKQAEPPRTEEELDQIELDLKRINAGIINGSPYTPMTEEERAIRRARQTPYDRIKHLLGSITDLPSDLLTNPKYMEDFGK